MRNFKYGVFLFFAIFFISCSDSTSSENDIKKIHWDRDMCDRCRMVISEKKFAVQVINPHTNKTFLFDDLGCAISWFEEENQPWIKEAKIWINDAHNGSFIDAKEAIYTKENITPMGYGFSAYTQKTKPKNERYFSFEESVELINLRNHEYQQEKIGTKNE
ncbi:MAG: hypothetical protein C0626_11040 [Arcobacter sp.]|uniref:hypothetical protein n=1 Tax=uncultured Arcobacter sp. TaxID=165434 RepID=UPI000CC8004C|nr:hypothetical protein [uncultured Arcobacter sp.]PLY09498.1 MAG: hypothetical protein C0626_11040 [Arcobacter sp.]